VVVDPGPEGEEGEVRLRVVKSKRQKTPVGVGAEGTAELPAGEADVEDAGVADEPAESPPAEQ
jgi:hypothetical protein